LVQTGTKKILLIDIRRTFLQEVILVTSTCINYFLVVSAAGAAVVSTAAAVVSTVAAVVSTVTAGESVVASVVSALLQAVIKPATARIANTFFIVLVFGFFYLVAKIVYYDI
jgi:uncharacterized membrane protein YvlD (DUF360 family)